MRATLHTRFGTLRCASERRFVIVRNFADRPRIVARSDSLPTLRERRLRERIDRAAHLIVDTHTGEEVTL